jgi:protein gp37
MSANTKIEWADHTFNPWEGCTKVGPGCDNCYAENRNARFAGGEPVNWGPGAPRRRTSIKNWQKPAAWNRQAAAFLAAHGRRQRVFCASLADVFDNEVDPQWRADLFALIDATPDVDWLLLTKRIGNVNRMLDEMGRKLPVNVWLGATIVNQTEAERDIPKLLAVHATVHFLSMEPLLGPVDLTAVKLTVSPGYVGDCLQWYHRPHGDRYTKWPGVDWVIVGGESGPGARLMHPKWAQALRDQCAEADVAFLFKQWGEWRTIDQGESDWFAPLYRSNRIARAGEDQAAIDDAYGRTCTVKKAVIHSDGTAFDNILAPGAWTQGSDALLAFQTGKKLAGRLLDGVQYDGVPVVSR